MGQESPAPARRWPRRLAIAAGTVAVLLLLVRVLLPTAIERGAAWAGPRWLGLPVRIDNVDLSLLRGRVTVEGLAIGSRADAVLPESESAAREAETGASPAPGASAREPLLRWDRVFAEFDWLPLFSRTLRLGALEIDAPNVRLERRPDGRIDPLAHAQPTAPPAEPEPEPAEPEPPGEPWTVELARLALRGPDVRIADEASGELLVQLGLEELALDRIALRGQDLGLGGVGIRGPVLRVRRDFVFAERPAPAEPPPAPEAAPPAESAEGSERGYRVDEIAIERAQFTWISEAGPLDVALTLNARDVTADEGQRFPLRLALELEDGRLELEGEAGLLPPAFTGRLAWQELALPPLLAASSPELGPWLRAGRSSADLQVDASLAQAGDRPPGVRLSGQVALAGLSIADPKDEEVSLGWQALEVGIREVTAPLPQDGAPATTRVALERVRLVAPDVRYAPPTPALDALLGGGAPATPEGDAEPAPSEQAAAEPPPAPEAPPEEPAAPTGGIELDLAALELADGRLRFEDRSGEQPLTASIDGLGVEAAALALRTAGGAPRVTLERLAVNGQAVDFADARGAAPRSGGVEGLSLALTGIEAAAGASPAAAVATFALDGEALRFEDETVDPPYRGRLRDLVARAEGLRFPERVAQSLKVTGASADGGRFELTGRLAGDTGQATLTLNRLALAPFNPYTTSAAGYRVGGAASLKTSFRMRGERYETQNRITLHKLDVSSRDPGDFERRFGVPLDVALALLRDPAGDIALSVPVTVDEKGTSTGVGSVVAGALRQALVGALTSPLKLLGSVGSGVGGLLGGDGGGIAPIASEPGASEPAGDQGERYEGLVRLLAERPQLGLRLRGRTGDADRPFVAQRLLAERIEAGDGLPEIPDGGGFLARRRISRALVERARGEEGELDDEDEALLARYVAAVSVPEERMAGLARARAEAVREEAVREFGVAPERLAIGDPAPAGEPGVVLELAAAGG